MNQKKMYAWNIKLLLFLGETSAGKTTLINQLIGKKVFVTGNLATTGKITRIRDSETIKIKCFTKEETLKEEKEVKDIKKLRSIIEELTKIQISSQDGQDQYFVDVHLPVPILKVQCYNKCLTISHQHSLCHHGDLKYFNN